MGCNHTWLPIDKSNVLQFNYDGNPLRLYICKCIKCGTHEMRWIESDYKELKELRTGKSVLLKWQ